MLIVEFHIPLLTEGGYASAGKGKNKGTINL